MAVYANLSIDQGSTFAATVTVEAPNGLTFDLTGYTARGQIRKTYTSTTAVSFITSIPAPTTGEIDLSLSATTTAGLKPGRYQFDIEITMGSTVQRVIEGQVEVNPRVTRVS
jgi:hypothetical protein